MRNLLVVLIFVTALFSTACSRPASQEEAKESTEAPAAKALEMTSEAQRNIGLQVQAAEIQELKEYLEVPGTVQPIDSRIGHVRPLAKGRLQSVLVKVGDRVRRNQVLAQFDTIEAGELIAQLEVSNSDLARLRVQSAVARKQLDRVRDLVRIGALPQKDLDSSQAEFDALEASIRGQESVRQGIRTRLKRFGVEDMQLHSNSITPVVSPFDGIVIDAPLAPGTVTSEGTDLFQIADLSHVWVQAEVYEKDLARIRVGQAALISVDTYPDQKFAGNVSYVGDILDPKTRTTKVRCEVANSDARLKLDMFAKVALPTTFSRRTLAISAGAIQQLEKENMVFVKTGATKFEMRKVQIGRSVNQWTEISAGLKPGDPVVSNGAFHLKAMLLGGELGEKD